jgi:hypothetical protein
MSKPKTDPREGLRPPGLRPSKVRRLDLSLPPYPPYQQETSEQRLNRIIKEGLAPAPIDRPREVKDSQLTSLISSLMSIPTKISLKRGPAGVTLTASGATAAIEQGDRKTQVAVSPSGKTTVSSEVDSGKGFKSRISYELKGPVKLETSLFDMKWCYAISKDRWEMSMSWGPNAPDLSTITDLFRKGEKGLRGIVVAAGDASLSDASAFKDAVSQHLEPVAAAVKTAARIAQTRPGISLAFSASGPMSTTIAHGERGVEASFLLTIRF